MSEKSSIENRFERGLFASRWLMAPMYLGLAVALGMLTVIFAKELFYYLPQALELSAEKMILEEIGIETEPEAEPAPEPEPPSEPSESEG